MIRLYIGAALVAVLSLFIWRYNHISGELEKERTRAEKAESINEQMQLNQELENWAREEYLKELEDTKNAKEKLEDCIANKTCVATIRVRVPTACNSGSAASDSAGTEEYSAILSADSLRTRSRLESSIREWEAKHKLCLRTLENWATKP